jgi:hypothetical protein
MFLMGLAYRASSLLREGTDFTTYPGNLQLKIKNKRVSQTSSKFKSTIQLKIDSKIFFRLIPENSWFKFYKSAGFAREIQAGDSAFDEKFYVAAENRGLTRRLRSDKALRDSLIKLHDLGFNRFISNGTGYLEIDNPSSAIENPTSLLKDFEQIKSSLNSVEKSSFYTEKNRLKQSNSYRFGKLHGLSSWYNDKGEVTQRALYEEDQVISCDQKILDALAKEIGEF